jgi:hypothetical protein
MANGVEILFPRTGAEESQRSSYRRLAVARLQLNVYSGRDLSQREGATLLHGLGDGQGSWEELDCRQFSDDWHGDRTSLQLGGAAGGVVQSNTSGQGLISRAGTGTLFIHHFEFLPRAAQRSLCSIVKAGQFTPVGDPFPRQISCRIIIGSLKPLDELASSFEIDYEIGQVLGSIAVAAEDLIKVLRPKNSLSSHPSAAVAAAS